MYPTRRVLILFIPAALMSLTLAVDFSWLLPLLALDGLMISLCLLDAVGGLPKRKVFALSEERNRVWSHGRPETITYHVDNHGARRWVAEIKPDLIDELVWDPEDPHRLPLAPKQRSSATLHLTAYGRGTHHFGGLHLAITSKLGFWRKHIYLGEHSVVHVYPNLKQLDEYQLLARTNRLSLIGVRSARDTGGDTEFERLRDHQSDDPLNRIDWKATARREMLTVRDYQINKSQSLMLMVDSGRMMNARYNNAAGKDAGALIDLAIDAALMLAAVAVAQGDRVGLLVYADGIQRFIPPSGGHRQLQHLIHGLHDVQPRMVESRHEEAFLYLQSRERKRSLSICFTHVIDEVNGVLLETQLKQLASRHLPVAVLLQDRDLHSRLQQASDADNTFWQAGAAALIANERQQIIQRLEKAGALTLDVDASQLTARLVSSYLSIKAKHLL